jgi:hypothetical protein
MEGGHASTPLLGYREGSPLAYTKVNTLANTEWSPLANTEGSPLANAEGSQLDNTEGSPLANAEGSQLDNTEESQLAITEESPLANKEGSPLANTEGSPLANADGNGIIVVLNLLNRFPIILSVNCSLLLRIGLPLVHSLSCPELTLPAKYIQIFSSSFERRNKVDYYNGNIISINPTGNGISFFR